MNSHVSPASLALGSSRYGRDNADRTPAEDVPGELAETSPGDCVHRLLRLRSRRETHEEGTNYWGEVECST